LNNKITNLLFVYNEENRIRYFLDSLKDFCSVVIIDDFSEDKTVNIAKEYTDQVFEYKKTGTGEDPAAMGFALSHVKTEWVFSSRVDEFIPLPLQEKIIQIIENDDCDIIRISRLNILFGQPTKTWGDDYQVEFFKKDFIDYKNNALFELNVSKQARIITLPPIKELSIWHFSSYDIATYINANNRYSTITANSIINQRELPESNFSHHIESAKLIGKTLVGKIQLSRKMTLFRILFNPGLRFFWHYFIRGGIRSGWSGFVTSYLMMMEQMLTELKIWELENNISRDKINNYYNELKTAFVAGEIPDLKKDPFKN
jgi:glycosyltransferase involved in cell wall biosynthesis